MEEHFKNILLAVGENITRDGLVDTPKRAAKAMAFLTQGYDQDIKAVSYTHLTLPTICSV